MKSFFVLCFIALCSYSYAQYTTDPAALQRYKTALERLLDIKRPGSHNLLFKVDNVTSADITSNNTLFKVDKVTAVDETYLSCNYLMKADFSNGDTRYTNCEVELNGINYNREKGLIIKCPGFYYYKFYDNAQLEEIIRATNLNLSSSTVFFLEKAIKSVNKYWAKIKIDALNNIPLS